MKITFALLVLLICLQADLCAAETSIVRKVEPELAPDLELLTKIKNLPPNTWLKLPPFKVTGDLERLTQMNWKEMLTRGPYSRDYSDKAAWMPDRKRAIYAGGGHNNLPYNDVWEYDLAANTWICLYGMDQPAQGKPAEWMKENLVIRGGVLQTQRGGPPR